MKRIFVAMLSLLMLTAMQAQAQQGAQPDAPLFRDPITDGAADPCLVYNKAEKAWWMLYTQRRANVETAGVAYCYGNEIGIAYSTDNGKSWRYRGTLALEFERGKNTFWAPDVVYFNGVYHLFVSYIQGVSDRWSGASRMAHYTSDNLWDWKFIDFVKLEGDVIDCTLMQLADQSWRMWYKYQNVTWCADSKDLYDWKTHSKPVISDVGHEGAKAFKFKGHYWLITDQWAGMGVYRSDNLTDWTKQKEVILDKASLRPDDKPSGAHGDVVVVDVRAYIFYFTHPGRTTHVADRQNEIGNIPYEMRRSSIQVAELEVEDGVLKVKDRDKPFGIYLPNW